MTRALLNYLACPQCRADLLITADDGATRLETGTLTCSGCRSAYPIVRGIPRFPIATARKTATLTASTKKRYSFAWKRFGEAAVAGQWEKDSYEFSAMLPRELMSGAGRVGLDAGCGAGLDLIRMAEGGAEIIGFDLSDGVEAAQRLARDMPNVHLVQGDLNAPPFRPATFDFVYSFGVLHHLPDPAAGFSNLGRLLKDGAPLITYVYEDFGDRTSFERALLAAVRAVRAATTRLSPGVLYGLCCLGAPIIWATCSVPARVLRPLAPGLAGRIPFRHTMRWNVLASDLYDRFAPPVERRYSREQVRALYQAAGFDQVQSHWYRGWVSWGWRASSWDPPSEPVKKSDMSKLGSDAEFTTSHRIQRLTPNS